MTTHQDVRPRAPKLVGRRTVTRTAAWSIPVVSLAVAAPAMAVSGCTPVTGALSWDVFADNSNQLNKVLTTTVSGVTVKVTVAGDFANGNGNVVSTTTGGKSKVMRFYDRENKTNTSQTILITFSTQVQNVQLSLLDVDSQNGSPTNAYEDLVVVNTPGYTGTKHSNIKGSGTSADPYRAKTTDGPVNGSSDASNIDLSWAGKLSTLSFDYAQDGRVNGGPFIGISDITFQTVC